MQNDPLLFVVRVFVLSILSGPFTHVLLYFHTALSSLQTCCRGRELFIYNPLRSCYLVIVSVLFFPCGAIGCYMIVTVSDYAHFPFVYKSNILHKKPFPSARKIYTNNVSLAYYFITFHVTDKYYIDVSEHIVENLKKFNYDRNSLVIWFSTRENLSLELC